MTDVKADIRAFYERVAPLAGGCHRIAAMRPCNRHARRHAGRADGRETPLGRAAAGQAIDQLPS